jgi:thioredoxin reductase (NADPH)
MKSVNKPMKSDSIRLNPVLSELKLDGVFVAIGHKPDTDLFKNKIELDTKGYIITAERAAFEKLKFKNLDLIENFKLKIENYRSLTSVTGVFAAGDCVDHVYRQAATASGMGVAAALEVERYLET